MQQGTAVSSYDQRHRIQSFKESKTLWDPFDCVQDGCEIEPEQHYYLQGLNRVSQEDVESRNNPAQSLGKQQQHEHIKKDPQRGKLHTVESRHDSEEYGQTDQVVNQIGNCDGDREDLGWNNSLCDQRCVVGNHAAIPDDGVAKKNPRKKPA